MEGIPVSDRSLQELLPDSLTSSFCVSLPTKAKVWVVAGMLAHYLESFTDSVVVRDDNYEPVGVIGGKDIIERIIENPSSAFFDNTNVEEIMDKKFVVSMETKLRELIGIWKQTRRAFAIIPNELHDYSAISTRKLLEIGWHCKTDVRISSLPKKKVLTFRKDDTARNIINMMLENKTRRLLLENSSHFINDRIIIEKIAEDLEYLRNTNHFLDIPASSFKLGDAKVVSEDLTIPQSSKILFDMPYPYLIYGDQVTSPWDICLFLLSDELTEYEYV